MGSVIQKKKKLNWKLWLILFLLAIAAGYLFGGIFSFSDVSLENWGEKITYILQHPFQGYYNEKTKGSILVFLLLWLIGLSYAMSNLKNYMPGKEMGSAEWGDPEKFNKKLRDPKGDNMVLSQHLRKSYDTKKTLLNNNITCVGGSGAGKTAGFVAANVLEFHGSNVFTDPKGDTLKDFGPALLQQGVRLRVLNMVEMWKSHRYNPFQYIRTFADITRLITNLMANTTAPDANKGDPFWEKAELLYLQGIFAYVWLCCDDVPYYRYGQLQPGTSPEQILPGCKNLQSLSSGIWRGLVVDENGKPRTLKKTFRTVLMLLDEASVSDDEDRMSALDCRMEVLKQSLVREGKDPLAHPALKNYYRAIRGAGDTVRSIIISANARFAPFDNEDLLNILDGDDIDLPSLGIGVNGDETTRTALFCVLPDDDTTFNFVAGMLYTQMFQELYRVARQYGNKLPLDVGFWFDEFANIKMPSDFDKILATCRSRNIYCVIILQSMAQIKALYKDKWEGLLGNCDTIVYLGGNEQSSHKYFSELLGKWTIDKRTTGQTLGSHGSSSRNFDILGRELMTPDEIKNMPNEDSLIFVRSQNPVYDKKMYWFQQKKWDYIKELEPYEFVPLAPNQFTLLHEKSIAYLKRDPLKHVVEYDCGDLATFLSLDLQKAERQSEESIKQQIQEIREQKDETDNWFSETESNIGLEERELSLEEMMLRQNMSKEQIAEMSKAIINGVPEDVLMDIARTNASAERIRMIVELYAFQDPKKGKEA